MRSTVDILDTLDQQLRERAKRLGLTYKEAINQAVASGLRVLEARSNQHRSYKVRAKQCGFRPGVDIRHLNRVADELADEREFR